MTPLIKRNTAISFVVGLLCILGIGMAAATLQTTQPIGTDDNQTFINPPSAGEDIGSDVEINESGDDGASPSGESKYSTITTCVPFLESSLGVLLMLGAVLAFMVLLYARFNFAISMLAGWTVFPPTMLLYFLATDCGGDGQAFGRGEGGTGIAEAAGETLIPTTQFPTWAMGLFVGIVLVGAAAVLYRSAAAEDVIVLEETTGDDEPDLDSFAQAAGRAADRIEQHNQDVNNAVFKAWVEMTELLDVENPETYTSGQFAEAAITIGMAESDIEELTQLFNEVRYGGKDPDTREERSIEILRNIESEYGQNANATVQEDDRLDETDRGQEISGTGSTDLEGNDGQ